MGYTTEFEGDFSIYPQLGYDHQAYLERFVKIRHMKRDPAEASKFPDPLRVNVELPIGEQGMYFVNADGVRGQDRDTSILDYNYPPKGVPGLWCSWEPDEEGLILSWDGSEKFYDYVEWLKFLITHFFAPWGYTLNGEVYYEGEDSDDFGKIIVVDNVVTVKKGRKTYD